MGEDRCMWVKTGVCGCRQVYVGVDRCMLSIIYNYKQMIIIIFMDVTLVLLFMFSWLKQDEQLNNTKATRWMHIDDHRSRPY